MGGGNSSCSKPRAINTHGHIRRPESHYPYQQQMPQQVHYDRMPDSSNLHDYTKAAKEFIDKQAFK